MNSNYPYNPYNYNPGQYQQQYNRMQQNGREKRDLRRRSTIIACGIIIYVIISTVLILLVLPTDEFKDLYDNNSLFSNCVQVFVSIPSLLGAYFIARALLDKKHEGFIPFGMPENKKHALLLIPFGICACLAGSWATGYLDTLIEKEFNVVLSQPEMVDPKTGFEAVVYLISMSVVPAFIEEIALRAGVLQAMRKYGDWFAIVTSAFIFAILHGNLIQTPFAFIAGIALGYIFIATGSIWPGIIIHFVNNFVSCVITMLYGMNFDEEKVNIYFGIYALLIAIIGTVCFVVYMLDKKKPAMKKDTSTLTLTQKTGAFILNVPMIISILYVCFVTSRYIAPK